MSEAWSVGLIVFLLTLVAGLVGFIFLREQGQSDRHVATGSRRTERFTDAQHEQAIDVTKLNERCEERFKTVFERLDAWDLKHDRHVERMDRLCDQVSALVARFDMLFTAGRGDALARLAGRT